jgi:hypothetical protein
LVNLLMGDDSLNYTYKKFKSEITPVNIKDVML